MLAPVTRENVTAICELRLGNGQERLVARGRDGHALVENGARGFRERCGFADTGRIEHGEPRYRKDL